MKFTCRQTDLSAKLSLLSRIVPTNPNHPILANVMLRAETDQLQLSVFDLSLGIEVKMAAEVEANGSLTLPARLLSDIVSRLPNTEIALATDEMAVTITCGTGSYRMQGLSAEEFPALPKLETVSPLEIPSGVISEGLQSTLFATSTDESKQILTGLHLSHAEAGFELAATDGHRLAISVFPEVVQKTATAVTIPTKALRELERLLGRNEHPVRLRLDATQAVFELDTEQGTEHLSCRLLEGQYPSYNQLMPTEFVRQVTVECQQLLNSVERVAVLAVHKNNIIRLKLDSTNQRVGVSADAPEFGSGEEFLAAQISGDPLEVAFNAKYLSDGLKAMGSREIQLQLNSETTPAVIVPLSGRKIQYLIMPIQIR